MSIKTKKEKAKEIVRDTVLLELIMDWLDQQDNETANREAKEITDKASSLNKIWSGKNLEKAWQNYLLLYCAEKKIFKE